eukprot:gene6419-7152_t
MENAKVLIADTLEEAMILVFEKKHKILWQDETIKFSGMPLLSSVRSVWIFITRQDHYYKRKYNTFQDTKKFKCPARIHMKEIFEFPENIISADVRCRKEKAPKEVREKIDNKSVICRRKIVITFPSIESHKNYEVGQLAGLSQVIDPFLVRKITELVTEEGISGPRTIRNHIVKVIRKLRRTLMDQERLIEKISKGKGDMPSANIYFRPKSKPGNKDEADAEEAKNGARSSADEASDNEWDDDDNVKVLDNNSDPKNSTRQEHQRL